MITVSSLARSSTITVSPFATAVTTSSAVASGVTVISLARGGHAALNPSALSAAASAVASPTCPIADPPGVPAFPTATTTGAAT